MSNRRVGWLACLACFAMVLASTGCTSLAVSNAARSGVASFINGVFNAAVYDAIGP